jgi:type II secretion system protein D
MVSLREDDGVHPLQEAGGSLLFLVERALGRVHPGGMKDGSRGLSEAQRAIPPVTELGRSGTPEGCQTPRRLALLRPLRGRELSLPRTGGLRCAATSGYLLPSLRDELPLPAYPPKTATNEKGERSAHHPRTFSPFLPCWLSPLRAFRLSGSAACCLSALLAFSASAQAPAQPAPAAPTTNAVPEVVIAVDKNANALILSGPAQELDNIDRIITELSLNFYSNEAEFRLFPLADADPVIVARTLTDLLKPEPVAQPPQPGQPQRPIVAQQPRITVVAEPRTRSVIVRARPTDFTLLESLIKQLDSAGQAAQLEFRLVPLTNAPPDKTLPLVQQLVTQHNLVRPGDPLTVSMDARSRGLLVVARSNVIDQVERMIRSLDTPSSFGEAEVLVVTLKKANAGQLALVLQNMLKPGAAGELTPEARELQEQVRRLKIQNDAGQAVTLDLTKPIKIAADPATGGAGGGNRLVLTSTPDNLKALAAVAAMMDNPAVIEGVEVRLIALQRADATAVSQTLTTIFAQGRQLATGPGGPGAQPEGTNGAALVNPLNVAADPRSNTLILSGRKETLDLAQRVVADLDKQIEKFVTEVRLFRLKHASASKLLPLLQSVFAEGPSVAGTEGLATQVTRLRTLREAATPAAEPAVSRTSDAPKSRAALVLQADDLSNILLVAARGDLLPLIADIIEQLDIPAASGLETIRFYPLNHADPAAIQKILNDIYTSPRATTSMRAEDKPVITVDARTSALIVAGNSKSFAIIEGLLQQLDQRLAFELRDIRILPLDNADASVIAATVQRLMDARVTQRATLNQGSADALKVTILADPRSNALLVAGGREAFEMVESLAKQLDRAGPALSGRIRLIPVQFADARVLAATLTTLFDQRYAALRATEVQRNKPIILADPRSNSLLVTANQEDNGAIDDLLKKLDAKTENPALTLTVIPLRHNDAARVAGTIENIFAARLRAQTLPGQTPLPSEQIKLEPDAINNALIVSASKENLELIQSLLQKIDVEPAIEGGLLQTFTLEFADAQRVAAMLRTLVQQGLYRPGLAAGAAAARAATQRDALAISVDPRSNTMFVSASPENLAVVREVIRRVDTRDFAGAGDMKLYPLKNARASSLATVLEQFFRAKRTADTVAVNASERSIPVSVIPDDRVNTLLIVGSKEAFDAADRLIQQLDGDSVFSRLNFKIFPLQKATATKLQATLQSIVANRPPRVKGEPIDPINIVADQWANALLVAASVEDMGTVESLIQRLDAEAADTGISVHFFPLAKADARRVAQVIQGLFREGVSGTTQPVTVTADERINAIVVSCGAADARRIGELVKKLDTEQVARVSEIKVFPLKYARAEALSGILNTALNTKPTPLSDQQNPNAQSVLQFITRTEGGQDLVTAALKEAVLITPDARMNSLIISGPVDHMGLLEQIIGRLDQSSPQQAKIKVFPLKNADVHQMATLLMQMFRMTATTAVGATQRSIQYTLVRPRLGEDGTPLGEEEMASATVGTAEQNALTVTVDPRTNSLLIGGTDHYVELVSQIIESLDASPANERKTEVVQMKNAQAQEVATAIRTFLDQERQRVTQVLGPEAVGTVQRLIEREVAVVAVTNSNTLLVSANPRYFEEIKAIIDELDKAQPQVLIQVVIAEVTLDSLTDLGVEWSHNGAKGDVTYGIGTDFSVKRDLMTMGGFSTAVTGSDFSFLLRALKNDGRLQVLSRPQIVTADNRPATINIGQRVPLITDSRVTERGDTINSFRYEDVGVNLAVTPKISPDGFVKLDIGTTNSAISSSTVEINASATVPIINQRTAKTTVSAQSGQTVLIGGLISTTDDRRVKKMPVLGDIPLLGALFRSSHNTRDRKELLILLTPLVLASASGSGVIRPIEDVTREQLNRSGIKNEKFRDDLEKQLLEPLFPPLKKSSIQPQAGDRADEL